MFTTKIAKHLCFFDSQSEVYVDQKNQWKAENTWMLCETAENDSWPWRTSEKHGGSMDHFGSYGFVDLDLIILTGLHRSYIGITHD